MTYSSTILPPSLSSSYVSMERKDNPINLSAEASINKSAIENIVKNSLPAKKERDVLQPLDQSRVNRLRSLLCTPIEISLKSKINFVVSLKKMFLIISKELPAHKKKAHLHGGEAGNIQASESGSNDIDTQCKLPEYTDRGDLNRVVECITLYFSQKAGMEVAVFKNEKILKISRIWTNKDRFYTVAFRDIYGVKYDFGIVARTVRKYLFFHDALKIPLNDLINAPDEYPLFHIVPVNLLKNGLLPSDFLRNKIQQTEKPETINFPGCLRLISNYGRGFVCKEEALEKELMDSLFKQLEEDLNNDLKRVIYHDIEEHHNKNYAGAIAFAFNFLTALLRQGQEHRYEWIRSIFIEIFKEFPAQQLSPPLDLIEKAILSNKPSLLDLATGFQAVSLAEREDVNSSLFQCKTDNHFLIFHKILQKAAVVDILPVLIEPEIKEAVIINEKKPEPGKEIGKPKAPKRSGKQLFMELSKDRRSWGPEKILAFGEELIWYLQVSKLSSEQQRKIIAHIINLLKELLAIDPTGCYCIPLFEQLLKHNLSVKLDFDCKKALREKWVEWILHGDEKEDVLLGKIFSSFIDPSSLEQSLIRIKTFLANKTYKKAKLIADKLPSDKIPENIRLELLYGIEETNTFEALEQYLKYRKLLLKSPMAALIMEKAKDAVIYLSNYRNLTPHRIEVLIQSGCYHRIVNGDFWSALLPKALGNEKTYRMALNVFFDTVVPHGLIVDNNNALHTAWKAVISKMAELHDERLKKLIADPQPVLHLQSKDNPCAIDPLLENLKKEAFHRLKIELLTPEEYGAFYEFLSKYATHDRDSIPFISVYLLSPRQEYFIAACERLKKITTTLKLDELVKLAMLIESGKPIFSEKLVRDQLKEIIRLRFSGKSLFKQFNITSVFARACPSVKNLIRPSVDSLICELLSGNPGGVKEDYEYTIEILTDLILTTDMPELEEDICRLLSHPPYIKIADEEKVVSAWGKLIKNYLQAMETKNDYQQKLKALDFFHLHFSKVFENEVHENACLKEFVNVLTCLFTNQLPLFLEQVEKFLDYLAEGNPSWRSLRESSDQLKLPLSDPLHYIKNYQFFSRLDKGVCLLSKEYIPPPPEYINELQDSRIRYNSQWNRFTCGAGLLCETLLDILPLEKEHDEIILSLTAETIELLMLGDANIPVEYRDYIQKNNNLLLDLYLSRNGYLSAELFTIQLQKTAHLFSCAVSCDYIDKLSGDFLRYILYLDKGIAKIVSHNHELDYEEAFLKLIRGASEGNAYHLFRMCNIMFELKPLMKRFSNRFRTEYLATLKAAINHFPKNYVDAEGFALGKALREIPL